MQLRIINILNNQCSHVVLLEYQCKISNNCLIISGIIERAQAGEQ